MEARHRRHSKIELTVSHLPVEQEELREEIIHDSVGRFRSTPHQIDCGFSVAIGRDHVGKRQHSSAVGVNCKHRCRAYIIRLKRAQAEPSFAPAWNLKPFIGHALQFSKKVRSDRRLVILGVDTGTLQLIDL
jgi:hypothetical protein